MNRTRKIIIAASIVFVAIGITSPYAWRFGTLYWAKSRARQIFSTFSPNDRRVLDQTPVAVVFPPINLESDHRESAELHGYRFNFPKPISRSEKPPSVLLEYGRYQVLIRPPV